MNALARAWFRRDLALGQAFAQWGRSVQLATNSDKEREADPYPSNTGTMDRLGSCHPGQNSLLRRGDVLNKHLLRYHRWRSSWSIILARPPGQDLYKRSLGKISLWDLCTRSLSKLSLQVLCKRPLGKISATGSLCNVSVQGLHKRCHGKISVQDLYKRSLGRISVTGLLARS